VTCPLRPGDAIAGMDPEGVNRRGEPGVERGGVVAEVGEPNGARWWVVIEVPDTRKGLRGQFRHYRVLWPLVR
jgi:hypothetical protein